MKGRKRHLLTDTLGLVLAVIVTAVSVHDPAGGKQLLTHPSVTKVWADGGYQGRVFNYGAALGIWLEVVKRPSPTGFQPLPERWVIERTFGWLMHTGAWCGTTKHCPSDHGQ
ncbi:transposase [Streptomyces chartreusis]